MVVVNLETARRRSSRTFAGVVLVASSLAFAATFAVGANWQRITSFAAATFESVSSRIASQGPTDIDAGSTNHGEVRLVSEARPKGERVNQGFAICGSEKRVTCVVDGDTFWLHGQKIRIADIDTPEISQPGCARELALGEKAQRRLQFLLSAGPFEMHTLSDRDVDRYGRSLRILVRNGHSIGDKLVAEGLAHSWEGQRRPWCGG